MTTNNDYFESEEGPVTFSWDLSPKPEVVSTLEPSYISASVDSIEEVFSPTVPVDVSSQECIDLPKTIPYSTALPYDLSLVAHTYGPENKEISPVLEEILVISEPDVSAPINNESIIEQVQTEFNSNPLSVYLAKNFDIARVIPESIIGVNKNSNYTINNDAKKTQVTASIILEDSVDEVAKIDKPFSSTSSIFPFKSLSSYLSLDSAVLVYGPEFQKQTKKHHTVIYPEEDTATIFRKFNSYDLLLSYADSMLESDKGVSLVKKAQSHAKAFSTKFRDEDRNMLLSLSDEWYVSGQILRKELYGSYHTLEERQSKSTSHIGKPITIDLYKVIHDGDLSLYRDTLFTGCESLDKDLHDNMNELLPLRITPKFTEFPSKEGFYRQVQLEDVSQYASDVKKFFKKSARVLPYVLNLNFVDTTYVKKHIDPHA